MRITRLPLIATLVLAVAAAAEDTPAWVREAAGISAA
jgi:hypothetical protein